MLDIMRLTRVGSLLILLGLAILIVPSSAWGKQITETSTAPMAYERFLTSTEALYDAVNEGKLESAMNKLAEIELQFRALPMKAITTAEGVQALAQSITQMKRTVAAISPDERRWKSDAAALRLAADALVHTEQPLWHRYRSILEEDVRSIKKALEQQKASGETAVPEAAIQELEQLKQHYEVIRTAVLLKSEPATVERADSVIRYVSRILGADPPNPTLQRGMIAPLEAAVIGLFPSKETETAFVPPISAPSWGWPAMMGSFIVTILTWVGWKRYKIEPYSLPGKTSNRGERKDAAERLIEHWKRKR